MVVGYNEAGAPKTKNVLAKSKKECLSKLKGLMEQYHDPISERIQPSMTFGAWLDLWYQNDSRPKLRKTTQQHYENLIYHHLIPSVGDIPLDQLTLGDLQQFFKRMKDCGRLTHTEQRGAGLSDRTVRSCHAVCQMALDKAVEERLIYRNPAVGCKLPSLKSKEMKVLTQQEIQRFLIQAKAEGMYELFLLDLTTGMRRGECCGLQWGDINWQERSIHIQRNVVKVTGEEIIVKDAKLLAGDWYVYFSLETGSLLQEFSGNVPGRRRCSMGAEDPRNQTRFPQRPRSTVHLSSVQTAAS